MFVVVTVCFVWKKRNTQRKRGEEREREEEMRLIIKKNYKIIFY